MGAGLRRYRAILVLLPLAACAGATLAMSSFVGAPPDADETPFDTPHVETMVQNSVDDATVGASGRQAATLSDSLHFDLNCSYQGRVTEDPHPRPRGNFYETEWTGSFRYSVDLQKMKYCPEFWCEHDGSVPVPDVNSKEIVFVDDSEGDPTVFETVRRVDGYYSHRLVDSEGYTRVTTGSCQVEPFSGLPDRRPEQVPSQ